jgi:hypothetical protein
MGGVSRPAILLLLSIASGGLLWKVPPFEIPHDGRFWELTQNRFWELVLFTAKQAGALILLAVIVSPFYALLADRNVMETALNAAALGGVIGTALGCLGWTTFRVLGDVDILRAEQERLARSSKPGKTALQAYDNQKRSSSLEFRRENQKSSNERPTNTVGAASNRRDAMTQRKRQHSKRTRRKRRHR